MGSSAIWKKTRTSEFIKDYQNSTTPKDECYLRALKNSRVLLLINNIHDKLLINNIHDKVMQNWVIRSRHVQTNLFTSYCQSFRTKNICLNDRSKTMRFNYKNCCISFFGSQPIRITKVFSSIILINIKDSLRIGK